MILKAKVNRGRSHRTRKKSEEIERTKQKYEFALSENVKLEQKFCGFK